MAKIIFINRFFYPDQSATSQIVSDLAFEFAKDGHEVHAVTSRNKIAGSSDLPERSRTESGVIIHRVGRQVTQPAGQVSRFADFLAFYGMAAPVLRRHAAYDSFVIAMTDPPMLSVWARSLLRDRHVHFVNWLQDVYPEVAMNLDVPLMRGRLGRLLKDFRDRSLRGASFNVVLGSRMRQYVENCGAEKSSLRVIPNWVDDRVVRPIARHANPLRAEWGLADKFVVGYSGNLGRAHEFETVVCAAERLRGRRDLRFVFIGGGFQYVKLQKELRERGLEDVAQFKPYQEQSELACSLSVADAHWLSLRPEFENLIVPSKFYGIAAAGRPILAIVDPNGEIAALVKRFNCGAVVEPGNGAGLAQVLEAMMDNRAIVEEWGRNARLMVESHFSRAQAIDKWREIIRAKHTRQHPVQTTDHPSEQGEPNE
jgi:colanic acid biosynthesis glycosyl transferase WcaI